MIAEDLIPDGFSIEEGLVVKVGLDRSSLVIFPHTFLFRKGDNRVICPVAGQFVSSDDGFGPGGKIRFLNEKAPELVHLVGEGCGVSIIW